MENTTARQATINYGYVVTVSLIAAIAGLLFGFDTGVIAGAQQFVYAHFGVTSDTVKGLIVAAVTFGALLGAVCSGKLSSSLGRRKSIILSSLLFTAGTLLAALAFDVPLLIIGRLIMGFAVGLSAMVVPMYLSEVSPPDIRGAVVFTFQLAITVGIMGAYLINYAFTEMENWRLMFGVGVVPSLLLFAGMLRLPESPRWLVLNKRIEEAEEVLTRIMSGETAAEELASIKQSVKHPQGGLKMLFSRRMFPLVLICFGLFVFQQLSGINTIFYFCPTVFESVGYAGGQQAIGVSLIPAAVNVLATVLGIWIVDKLGRRVLCVVGFIGMAACLFVLGADLNGMIGDAGLEPSLALGSVLLYIFFFAASMGGVPYIMMSELFPLNVRSVGMATASCANWGFNFLVSVSFLSLAHGLGFGNTFWLYGVCMVLGLFFTLLLVPETKGRALEDIEANLFAGNIPRKLGDPAATRQSAASV